MKRCVPAFLGLVLSACAHPIEDNPLIGDWVIDLPTTPRAHGNEIAFLEHCIVVRGNRIDVQIAKPVSYFLTGSGALVWFGTGAGRTNPDSAARVRFLSNDRIEVRWPEGVTARYLRSLTRRDADEAAALCGIGEG